LVLAHLFVKVPQPGYSEGTVSILSQAATCFYQSNRLKVEAVPLSALPNNERTCRHLHTISL